MGCCAGNTDFCVDAGETFDPIVRWSSDTLISKAISAISNAAPADVTTGAVHGLTVGWRVAVVSAKGMLEINAKDFPPSDDELSPVTKIHNTTKVELGEKNSSDYSAYTSGGWLVWYDPVDLIAATGTFKVWDNPERTGTPVISYTVGSGITLDNTAKTITISMPTAGVTWTTGYYALDMTVAAEVTRVLKGTITIV